MPINKRLLAGVSFDVKNHPRIFRKKTGNVLASASSAVGWLEFFPGEERIEVFRSPRDGVSWLTRDIFEQEKALMLQKCSVFCSHRGCTPAVKSIGETGFMIVQSLRKRIRVVFADEEKG